MAVKLTPYLVMNGNASEAIAFYERALDAKVLFKQTFGELPENAGLSFPAETKDRILHASIQIGESTLMLSDTSPDQSVQPGNQMAICLSTHDKEQSQRFFEALQQDGTVRMPLQETFFSPAYGILTDKFGITWQIHTEGQHK
ncbi:VOC family protein [Alicyclobacillus sp.]|uniref:VOC family protein n=1 Tax=Alicyclobacillus sp. TaxID=61169 RepID=UPI0025B9DB83|nr:VOC family protein [Alicyclobacillus sp.]MCL6515303.1 VOC family protein [Alicyclobacillus sp.]